MRFRPSGFDLKSPVAKSERPAPFSVLKMASAAAIFIGCCLVIRMPSKWPTITVAIAASVTSGSAIRIAPPKTVGLVALAQVPGGDRDQDHPGGQERASIVWAKA